MTCQALIDVTIISARYDGTSLSAWCVIWSDYARQLRWLPYKQLEPIGLSYYFSWSSHATNNNSFRNVLSDMLTLSETASPPDVIINACDPMQNPGQTQIFYKVRQTRLTRAKRDPVDPDDPTRFQP